MRTLFHPFLPNGLDGDPACWIDMPDEGRSVLLDLGDLRRIPSRKLLRTERAVVTHAHMDHFVGFDHLLRLMLGREKELVVTGPPGFLGHVRGKILAYTWNLIENYPIRLVAEELDGGVVRSEGYSAAGGMRPEPRPERPYSGTIHAERAFTMHTTVLDHGIPVLGVALHETERLSVDKARLEGLGLRPGPWLRDLKMAVRRCHPDDEPVRAETGEGGERDLPLGRLACEVLFRAPGQRIAYFTDLAYTPENRARVVELAGGVDLMICEAAFADEDEALARERNHLTAGQAGRLAREAGAGRLAPFHFSPRYHGRENELLEEAAEAFGGPVLELPLGPSRDDDGSAVL